MGVRSRESCVLCASMALTSFAVWQLLAACERDGEADRALEAFARMEREAPSKATYYCTPCSPYPSNTGWLYLHAGLLIFGWYLCPSPRQRPALLLFFLLHLCPYTCGEHASTAVHQRCTAMGHTAAALNAPLRRGAGTWGYVEPSAVTFNTLISACGKAGKYDEALQLFAKMTERGLQPDNFTVCPPTELHSLVRQKLK